MSKGPKKSKTPHEVKQITEAIDHLLVPKYNLNDISSKPSFKKSQSFVPTVEIDLDLEDETPFVEDVELDLDLSIPEFNVGLDIEIDF